MKLKTSRRFKKLLEVSKDKKIETIATYETESRKFPHSRSPNGIEVFPQKRGVEVGYCYAEAFYILREMID